MSALDERVKRLFEISIEAKIALAEAMSATIVKTAERLVKCLLNDGKIFICGIGASAANGIHFSTALLSHFEVERPPLPVINLSTDSTLFGAIAKDGQVAQWFARQIQALGQENDVLILLSTTWQSSSLLFAITAAHDRGMDVIVLSGCDGGSLVSHLGPQDIELRVAGVSASHIRELHLFILHCLCDLIDQSLFGQMYE